MLALTVPPLIGTALMLGRPFMLDNFWSVVTPTMAATPVALGMSPEPEPQSGPVAEPEPEEPEVADPEPEVAEPEAAGEPVAELQSEPASEPEPEPEPFSGPFQSFLSAHDRYAAAVPRINESLSGYLSAVGLVFGLLVAQIYSAVNRRMESMRDFVTREAGLLHRCINMLNALGALPTIDAEEGELCDAVSGLLIEYSAALQLEFKDREMLRWTQVCNLHISPGSVTFHDLP